MFKPTIATRALCHMANLPTPPIILKDGSCDYFSLTICDSKLQVIATKPVYQDKGKELPMHQPVIVPSDCTLSTYVESNTAFQRCLSAWMIAYPTLSQQIDSLERPNELRLIDQLDEKDVEYEWEFESDQQMTETEAVQTLAAINRSQSPPPSSRKRNRNVNDQQEEEEEEEEVVSNSKNVTISPSKRARIEKEPTSGYNLFMSKMRQPIMHALQAEGDKSHMHFSSLCSKKWRELTDANRAFYNRMSKKEVLDPSKSIANIQRTLICTICHDLLCLPILLTCGHSFCYCCYDSTITDNEKMKCPTCQKEIPIFILNKFVQSLIYETLDPIEYKEYQERYNKDIDLYYKTKSSKTQK